MRSIMFYLFWCKKISIPQAWIQVGATDTAWCNQPPGLWSSCSPRWGPLFPGAAAGNESLQAADVPWSMGLGSSEAPMKMMNMMNMMKTDEKWSNMVKWCMCRWSKSRSLTHGEKARERERESESATDFAWFSGMICILCTCRWCAHSEKMYWRDGVAILPQPAKWRKHGTESLRIVHEPTAEEWLGSRSFHWFDGQPGKKSEYVTIMYNYILKFIYIYIYKQLDATVFHHVFTVLLMCGLSFP